MKITIRANIGGDVELNMSMTLDELMQAQEGEGVQFKEAKNRFDFGEAARCCCALSNCVEENLYLVFQINDLARSLEARLLINQKEQEKA